MELFEALSNRRKKIRMSFEELSSISGVPVSTLKKIFTGVTANPPFETVRSIAHAMGLTTDDLASSIDGHSTTELSPAAMELARSYDRLSEASQRLISAIVLFESADISIKNKIISILVEHSNARLQSESPFAAASASALLAIEEEEETTPSAESK